MYKRQDLRGENTSEAGQMSYILGHPVAYAKILLQNIFNTLPSYVMGEKSLGLLGHQGEAAFPWLKMCIRDSCYLEYT